MSEDSAVDSAIDLKKRARRRLVGAAALALLAVIVLPIVMDSEPKPSGQEIQIRIPSQDSNSLAAKLIPGRPAAPLPSVQDTNKPAPDAVASKPVEATEKPVAPAPATLDDKTKAAAAKVEDIKKPDAVKTADAARAEAVLEGKDANQWIVQLGAYQNAANIKLLTGKLKDMGVPSYTEKFDSPQGVRIRVRAGPFKSHEAAEKARLRIKKIGVDGPVVQK